MSEGRGLVVIVEDEPTIADIERLYLTQAGYGVHVERDGAAGLAAIRRLHPVAVVIFSGLISSTLLDTFLTPALFWLFGRRPAERIVAERGTDTY
jgi:CheY-like chemotaxis protein